MIHHHKPLSYLRFATGIGILLAIMFCGFTARTATVYTKPATAAAQSPSPATQTSSEPADVAGTSAPHEPASKVAAEKAMINLDFQNGAVADVVKSVEKQSGIKMHLTVPAAYDREITISVSNLPAYQALRYITNLAGLSITYKDDGVHLAANDKGAGGIATPNVPVPAAPNVYIQAGPNAAVQANVAVQAAPNGVFQNAAIQAAQGNAAEGGSITANFENTPLLEAIKIIETLCKIKVHLNLPRNDKTVVEKCSFTRATADEVLQFFAQKYDLNLSYENGEAYLSRQK